MERGQRLERHLMGKRIEQTVPQELNIFRKRKNRIKCKAKAKCITGPELPVVAKKKGIKKLIYIVF